jgi:hypothetical protein
LSDYFVSFLKYWQQNQLVSFATCVNFLPGAPCGRVEQGAPRGKNMHQVIPIFRVYLILSDFDKILACGGLVIERMSHTYFCQLPKTVDT